MIIRLIYSSLALFLMVLVVGPIQAAYAAAPPTVIPLHFDETFVAGGLSNFCGFTIMRHDVVDGQFIIRHTAKGDEVDFVIAHGAITLSANGHLVEGRYSGFDRNWYYSDGSYQYLGVGTAVYIVLPSVGPVWGLSGSMTFILDPDGNVVSERYAEHDLFFSSTDVCTTLAP